MPPKVKDNKSPARRGRSAAEEEKTGSKPKSVSNYRKDTKGSVSKGRKPSKSPSKAVSKKEEKKRRSVSKGKKTGKKAAKDSDDSEEDKKGKGKTKKAKKDKNAPKGASAAYIQFTTE